MPDSLSTRQLIRKLQFLSQKDPNIFLKYNVFAEEILFKRPNLPALLKAYNLDMNVLDNIGVCICTLDYTGFQCRMPVVNTNPNRCSLMGYPVCNPKTSIYRPSSFELSNNIKSPKGELNVYKSYYCECTGQGFVGTNCEYKKLQCQSDYLNSPFMGTIADQTSICNPSKFYSLFVKVREI